MLRATESTKLQRFQQRGTKVWTRAQHGSGAACGRPRWRANDVNRDTGPTVGASDAEADAARSGSDDADLDDSGRDSDGVPVGSADAEADAENSGADRG